MLFSCILHTVLHGSLVKWHNGGLQNRGRGFDSSSSRSHKRGGEESGFGNTTIRQTYHIFIFYTVRKKRRYILAIARL